MDCPCFEYVPGIQLSHAAVPNSLAFETNKNLDKNLTDYYNLIYKYKNDCLEASLVYNKQFYDDVSINSDKNIFFKISIIPFGDLGTASNEQN